MLYTSIDNKKIKDIKKLHQKKYRDKTNTFLIETEHLVLEAYKTGYIKELILEQDTLFPLDVETNYVTNDIIHYISDLESPSNVMAICNKKEEKELFLKLISVKGLGPKMALPMLATGSISMIEEAIETENINYLKKFPKIGDKVARQLVLDLKGKLNVINTGLFKREDHSSELFDALVGLGYKQIDVKKIVSKVDPTLDLENQIKEALKLLLK